jgi:ribonuclease BN (tRNA processing enzyme)
LSDKNRSFGRRAFLTGLPAVAGAGLLIRLGTGAALGLGAAAARGQPTAVPSDGTHLVLLGTQGGPNFTVERSECANAVVVDGRAYLVDCGYGTLAALVRAGLNYRNVGQIFLTHLHDDHTSDVAALLSHQWTGGRVDPTVVIGPYGTSRLVDGALAFFEANTVIRLADEDRSVQPADLFEGRDIEATRNATEVFADDRVTVSSVENTHFPESAKERFPYRAVSYRLDSSDRSITISGDTAYSENLVRLAEGSDVFVCETMDVATARANFERRVAAGAYADNPEGIWQHIVETHSTTEDAGRMAAEAKVGTLVLSHIIPGSLMDVPDSVYLEGVRKHFDGEVVVGRDLMVI